jgi:hypothetical protein
MSARISFASHFDQGRLSRINPTLHVAIWFFISLIAIDVAINTFFAYPRNPKIEPSHLQAYFEYGRSTEGQLRRMTRADRTATAPITLTGWYDPLEVTEFTPKKPHNSIVTIYGMSNAVNLAIALGRVSDRFTPRSIGAPGATSNWAYGAYLRDRGGGISRAVVLTFQSSNLAMITTLSAMTWAFDAPMPYTADRFFLDGDKLQVIHPPYTSFDDYVATLNDPKKWSVANRFFAKHDPLYNSWLFSQTILDHSSLCRLAARAYGLEFIRNARRAVLDQTGFRTNSEAIRVARAIIHEFAAKARKDRIIPIIYLVNDFGYSNYLVKALMPALLKDNVPYLSSDSIISPDNPRGYLPNHHFNMEVDDQIARELDRLVAVGDRRTALR